MQAARIIADLGNSRLKLAVFQSGKIIYHTECKPESASGKIKSLQGKYHADSFIMSSVRENSEKLFTGLKAKFKTALMLSHKTPIPIKNCYESPDTLGKDRLAAVVGAAHLFPKKNILIFDAGTALTMDFINAQNQYLGGIISPGLQMRNKALNHFTGKLPLIKQNRNKPELFGKNTLQALDAGIKNGLLFEIETYIKHFKKKYKSLTVLFTGGDTFFFEKNIKNSIFAEPYLIMIGLNRILDYNAE